MVKKLLSKMFGSRNDRLLKKMKADVARINALEEQFKAMTDEELKAQTAQFRQRLADGATLDSLLHEAFAVVREAASRVLGMRHYDVQLIGGMVLHQGKIAEMRTGEGKTLVATLPVYLRALAGKGAHVVTVNDYLARRDAEWMGQVYGFLGLTTGVIHGAQDSAEKRAAYAADITYGTNNEFGFDYLRDNMAFRKDDLVQRGLYFAVVDEVDSILIDEARTPLIISGPADDNSELYARIETIIKDLTRQEEEDGPGDFTIDEKVKQVYLTEEGHQHAEELLARIGLLKEGDSLYSASNIVLLHHLNAALRAHHLFQRDVDYIVQDGEVVIVDEFTGRTMPGRRWSEGLHQAVEAKEKVNVQNENQTLASITFQNFFRLYDTLSGMTGTADTEAFEFQQIYGLEVVVIPPNKDTQRKDMGDLVYLTTAEKFAAIVEDIRDCHQRGQPVLVGTTSIENSELIANALKKAGIPHEVLNAKQHEREAEIVALAGCPGAVTIATNMAGRGTDIVLGGSLDKALEALPDDADEAQREAVRAQWQERHQTVLDNGGLHIIGTERHESRRIDNQLRGRSGRQGDPGSSRFYLSLEDSLMRIFASERVASLMQKLGMQEGEAIEHPWVTRSIENAQRKVEGHNFDIRKQLLEYDDVANDQRRVIYEQRSELLTEEDVSETIQEIRRDVVDALIDDYIPPQSLDEMWDIPGLEKALENEYAIKLPLAQWLDEDSSLHEETLRKRILEEIEKSYIEKEALVGATTMREFERAVMLQVLDSSWKDHLAAMDHLRQGIHLRGYAQKNPKQEYKREAFEMFAQMLEQIKHDVVSVISRVEVGGADDVEALERQNQPAGEMDFHHAEVSLMGEAETDTEAPTPRQPLVRDGRKIGRNEPCPCGSGKKYKQCHGRIS